MPNNLGNALHVAQLSQRDRAAVWVSFGWVVGDGVGQTILSTKRSRWQKTESIDLLQDKMHFYEKNGHFAFSSTSSVREGALAQRKLFILGSFENA